jgi:probable HAF family extracellular repeat protein
MKSCYVVFVAFLVLTLATAVSAQSYQLTDLGGDFGAAMGINDLGQVVGFTRVHLYSHAFLWSKTTGMVNLGTLDGTDSAAIAINNRTEVVGNSGTSAFLWTPSAGIRGLPSLGGQTYANGINNAEQVVGASYLPDGQTYHAFIWTSVTGMKDLGTLGGTNSEALAINDAGDVVGYAYLRNGESHAFLWTRSTGMQDLGVLGGTLSIAQGISPSGQVVGWSNSTSNGDVAFLWDPATGMHPLTTSAPTWARGINTSGQVVGGWNEADGSAFLWTPSTGLRNLNGLLLNKDISVTAATGLNRFGVIVGSGDAKGSRGHAVVITPTR